MYDHIKTIEVKIDPKIGTEVPNWTQCAMKRVNYSQEFNDFFNMKYGLRIENNPIGSFSFCTQFLNERQVDAINSGEYIIVQEIEEDVL